MRKNRVPNKFADGKLIVIFLKMSEALGLYQQVVSSNSPFKTQVQNVEANNQTTVSTPANAFAALVCFTDGNSTHFTLGTCTFIISINSSITANFSYSYHTGTIQATLTNLSLTLRCTEEFGLDSAKYTITWLLLT